MAEQGGYRRPQNPAPVSGPGALSQRTDGGVPRPQVGGLSYGENGALQDATSAAPLAAASGGSGGGGGAAPAPFRPPVALGDPTAYPDQPVTTGADAGAGVDSAGIGLAQDDDHELRQKLGPMLPVFMRMADSSYSTASYRRQVRQLIARIA